jgi:hypothetical protein
MAARKDTSYVELTRARIQTTKLLERGQRWLLGQKDENDHAISFEPHQITLLVALLRKTLPDLQAIEHGGEIELKHHVVQADPLTPEQWAEKYGAPAARPN